ncbi:MAG: hypothetical protein KAW12_18780 [Candidatus Aminicenantes bacterium]|nr:hypothetical protein [Candidatus Aminicenantes bacterium]
MKKVILLVMVFVLVFAVSAVNLKAQGQEMDLYVNAGLITDDQFTFDPIVWSGGINVDIHFSDMLMLSPECDVIFWGFKFDAIWLAPGVIANFKTNMLFVGGGITKWFKLSGNVFNSDLSLKLNVGFKSKKYRLTVYLLTPFDEMFKRYYTMFGATIGFAF